MVVFVLLALAQAQLTYTVRHPDQAAQHYDFTNTSIPSYRQFNYATITEYIENDGMDCDARFPASYDNFDFQSYLCSKASDDHDYRIETMDDEDSSALCFDPVAINSMYQLERLCTSIIDCHSFTVQEYAGRAYLNTYGCAVASNTNAETTSKLFVKDLTNWKRKECELGKGALVSGGNYPEVRGLYEMFVNNTFHQHDGLARIMWQDSMESNDIAESGCGWTIQRTTYRHDPVTQPAETCQDQNAAVNALFGFAADSMDYVDTICQDANDAAWSSGSYCENPSFRHLCSVSCSTDCEIDAADYACATADCSSAVDMLLCPVTCATDARRLATAEMKVSDKMVMEFRRSMRDAHANSAFKSRADLRRATRRLGQTAADNYHWEDVYRTWGSEENPNYACSSEGNHTAMDRNYMFDLVAFHSNIDVHLDHSCPGGMPYWAVAHDHKFCRRKNVNTLYNANKEVVANNCFDKCTRTAEPLHDALDANGNNNWCSGNWDTFEMETDALCLPREKCQEVCDMLGPDVCGSIDMHKFRPQCYLNTPECEVGGGVGINGMENATFDVLERYLTPNEEESVDDSLRDTYSYNTGYECTGAESVDTIINNVWADPSAWTAGTYADAEAACSSDVACNGFTYHSIYFEGTHYAAIISAASPSGAYVLMDGNIPCDPVPVWLTNATADWTVGSGWPGDGTRDLDANLLALLPTTVNIDDIKYEFNFRKQVIKIPHQPCQVVVTAGADYNIVDAPGVTTDAGEIEISGTYFKQFEDGHASNAAIYISEDNTKRLFYEAQTGNPGYCDQWVLQYNIKPEILVDLYNCTDHPPLANAFLRDYAGAPQADGHLEHPCQWGADEEHGWCEDAVFHALCAHTCTQLDEIEIAGQTYFEQNDELYNNVSITTSTCSGDNNWAAYTWHHQYHLGNPKILKYSNFQAAADTACADIAALDYTLADPDDGDVEGFCSDIGVGGIFTYLCKVTCLDFPEIVEVQQYKWVDETNATGALHGDSMVPARRLVQEEEFRYSDRKLGVSGYTTSSAGMPRANINVTFVEPTYDILDWVTVYQTYRWGSEDTLSPYSNNSNIDADYTFTAGDACPAGSAYNDQGAFDLIDNAYMNLLAVPKDYSVSMGYVCRNGDECPEFTTCILSPIRFQDSLAANGWEKGEDFFQVGFNFSFTPPKTLVTENRAISVMSQLKWKLGMSIFRNVPAATSVEVLMISPEIAQLAISLVSPSAASGYYAKEYFGRYYSPVGDGISGWITDVVRVEAFDEKSGTCVSADDYLHPGGEDCAAMGSGGYCGNGKYANEQGRGHDWGHDSGSQRDGRSANEACCECGGGSTRGEPTNQGEISFKLETGPLDRPELFRLYRISRNNTLRLLPAESYAYDGTSSFEVMLGHSFETNLTADFIGALATDECDDNGPCDAKATCSRADGELGEILATCQCNAGFDGDGMDGNCAMKAKDYEAAPGYHIRISHNDVINFGWRVAEIELYEDAECEKKLDWGNIQKPFPSFGDDDATYDLITGVTHVYTGPIGLAHYPHPLDLTGSKPAFEYDNGKMFDGNPATAWWSECLNCNPDTPQVIEFNIMGLERIECIKVTQVEGHASKSLTIERGPMSGEGCGMLPNQPRCEASMTWVDKMNTVDTMVLTCGLEATQIFGELMLVTGTNWEGSYANDHAVESPCHCMQLCIDHLSQGCRSWKYFEEVGDELRHCYLQSSIFHTGSGFHGVDQSAGFPQWTSGTPALRYTKSGKIFDKPWLESFEATPSVEDSVASGVAMDIKISATGLPWTDVKATDASDLQRMKIVNAEDDCGAKVPTEVTGISCIESVKTQDMLAGAVSTKIYTFCGPRPTAATSDEVTFSGLQITRADEDREYKICYCAFDCYEPTRWQVVPGPIHVEGSVFSWTTEPEQVYRKSDTNQFDVTITRPAFGSHSESSGWELKIVRDWFSCNVNMDKDIFPNINHADLTTDVGSCTPDVCTWTFDMEMDVDEVGRYLICFRTGEDPAAPFTAVPAKDGRKFITVNKLDADLTHPRGIFHNQYFSALAGSPMPIPIGLVGTRMEIPSASRITLTKGGCGDASAYDFAGSIVPNPEADVEAPRLLPALSYPAIGTTVSDDFVITLVFDEPVRRPEDCVGTFKIHCTDCSTVMLTEYDCDEEDSVEFSGNKVLLWSSDEGLDYKWEPGNYYVELETGTLEDYSGNTLLLSVDETNWVAAAAAGDDVVVALTFPPDQSSNVWNGTIELIFSQYVYTNGNIPADKVKLIACGADFVCDSDDSVVETFTIDDSSFDIDEAVGGGYYWNMVMTPTYVEDNQRYKVVVPANAFLTAQSTVGPTAPYEFEFVASTISFSPADVVKADTTVSMDGNLVFNVQLSEDTPEGRYSVCYCSGQNDENLINHGDFESRYLLVEDRRCDPTKVLAAPDNEDETIMGFTLADHVCQTKCAKGCTGPHCFCDGYTSDSNSKTLCLPKQLCAEACSTTDDCYGIGVHDDLPQCELISGTGLTADPYTSVHDGGVHDCSHNNDPVEEWQFFERDSGTPCSHLNDFSETAGSMFVTKRVDVGVDYIFTPGEAGSIELTGPEDASFSYEAGHPGEGRLSRDRITIIDCGGTCGISSPTSAISEPAMANKISTWNKFWPVSFFKDEPSMGTNALNNQDLSLGDTVVGANYDAALGGEALGRYTEKLNKYAVGHNLDLDDWTINIDGDTRDLKEHQCYGKCHDGCVGDHCNCDGFFSGFDTPTSNALCATEEMCQFFCDNMLDADGGRACVSIDMHMSLPRCFLNDADTQNHIDLLTDSDDYKVFEIRSDPNSEHAGSHGRLLEQTRMLNEESLLEVRDHGFSWGAMLRFKDITFKSGGTFKLCFCDSQLNGVGNSTAECKKESDYSVQVGTIHASGVSCLIAKKELQRVTCAKQYWGDSMRCYSYLSQAPMPEPPILGIRTIFLDEDEQVKLRAKRNMTCAFGAEEEGCDTEDEAGHQTP